MKRKNILGTIGIITLFLVIAFLYSYLSKKSINGQEWIPPTGYITVGAGSAMYTTGDSLIGISDLIVDNSTLAYTNSLSFSGGSEAEITINFDKDPVTIDYKGNLDQAAKVFLDYCRELVGKPISDKVIELAEEYEKHCEGETVLYRGMYVDSEIIWLESSEFEDEIKGLEEEGIEYALIKGIKIEHKQPTLSDFLDWLEKRKK